MKKRAQPRIPGVRRESSSTALLPEIDRKLKEIARRYSVSPSWVRATMLADALGIRIQPKYYIAEAKRRKRA
jgi:predicted transcriptional regulator